MDSPNSLTPMLNGTSSSSPSLSSAPPFLLPPPALHPTQSTPSSPLPPFSPSLPTRSSSSSSSLASTSLAPPVTRKRHAPIRSLIYLLSTLALSSLGLYLLLLALLPSNPPPDSDTPAFHFPTDLAGLKRLALALEGYAEHHTLAASTAFISTYLYFRAFSIPGCLPLNFLAGYLFGLPLGLALVCASTAVGASLCYLNSAWIIGPTVHFYLGARMRQWAKTVHAERDHLFSYLLILRLLPVLPSWFVSLAAPHLHIPLPIFALATLVGAIIPSFVHVQAGRALQSLDSLSSVLSPANILAILLLITLALAPVIIRKLSKSSSSSSSSSPSSPSSSPVSSFMEQGRLSLQDPGAEDSWMEEELEDEEDEEDEVGGGGLLGSRIRANSRHLLLPASAASVANSSSMVTRSLRMDGLSSIPPPLPPLKDDAS